MNREADTSSPPEHDAVWATEYLRDYVRCFAGLRDKYTSEPELLHAEACARAVEALDAARQREAQASGEIDRWRGVLLEVRARVLTGRLSRKDPVAEIDALVEGAGLDPRGGTSARR